MLRSAFSRAENGVFLLRKQYFPSQKTILNQYHHETIIRASKAKKAKLAILLPHAATLLPPLFPINRAFQKICGSVAAD